MSLLDAGVEPVGKQWFPVKMTWTDERDILKFTSESRKGVLRCALKEPFVNLLID